MLEIAARAAPEAVSFHIVRDGEQAVAYLKGKVVCRPPGASAARTGLAGSFAPGIDGFAVLAWIRQHPELSALKCLSGPIRVIPLRSIARSRRGRIGSCRSRFHSFAAGWPRWWAASRRRSRAPRRRNASERQVQSAPSRIPASSSGVSVMGLACMLLAWEAFSTNPAVCSRLRP